MEMINMQFTPQSSRHTEIERSCLTALSGLSVMLDNIVLATAINGSYM